MLTTASTPVRLGLVATLALAISLGAVAADDPRAAPAAGGEAVVLGAELVKTGLYLITGGGSNSLLRLSPSGSILVDGKQAGSYRALLSQLRKLSRISDLPNRLVIVTDHHAHHTGNHAQFLAAGMAVIAQQNAQPRLPAGPPPGAKPAGPVVTFDRTYQLRMGGIELHLHHFGHGHTDNDTVVHFPDLKVVAVGDLVTADAPVPDFSGGGSLLGWGPVLDEVLKLDFDLVVPSTGPLLTRADLLAFKARLDTLVARASVLVQQGAAKDKWLAQLKTDDLGWRLQLTTEQADSLFADLSARR